jgi:divalent metal cation (Fe/Co/Zn/Cd) transporter
MTFVRAITMRLRMSAQASSLPHLSPPAGERARMVRRAKALSWLSIGWMAVEAGVAIVAALAAGSVALLGFGLDSMIELASAGIIIWRFTGARHQSESAERRAQQLIAGCFGALALYLTFDGVRTLADGSHVAVSWAGAAVAAGAVIVMPLLARGKSRVAQELGSAATAGDAAQSMLCAIAAAGVLASIVANAALGWWWLDPLIGLGIAAIAIQEGRKAWAGDACGDCAPVGFGTSADAARACEHDC